MKKPITDPEGCTTNIRAMNDALELLSGKWKLLILHYLMTREQEENTFKKIEKDLNGISSKVLSKELKTLEANKLITRTEQKTKPIKVAYAITEYGKTTKEVIDVLVKWGMNHRAEIIHP